jgi:hypothetical protein
LQIVIALKKQIPPRSTIMTTVAEQSAEVLATAGIKRIDGTVGDSLNGLTDSQAGQDRVAPRPPRRIRGLRGRPPRRI